MKTKISVTLDSHLLKNLDSAIDGINLRNRSQAIEHFIKKSIAETKIAVILCGGKSIKTEKGDFRICAPFLGKTVIEYNINGLRKKGFKKIYITGDKKALIEIFKIMGNGEAHGVNIEYVEDNPNIEGSMDTLAHARKINQTFLVASGDIVFGETNIQGVWDAHIAYKGLATIHVQATMEEVENTGVVKLEGNIVKSFKQTPGNKAPLLHYSGFFVAEPEIFNYTGASLEEDVFPKLVEKGLLRAHLTSNQVHHFHTQKELNKIERIIEKEN